MPQRWLTVVELLGLLIDNMLQKCLNVFVPEKLVLYNYIDIVYLLTARIVQARRDGRGVKGLAAPPSLEG